MKKSIIILLTGLIIGSNAFALSQNLQISLLTQEPGDELYAFFGHTAIRVKDDSLFIDQVYNYGTFDFNTPNFYTRFVKGDLNYCLSIDDYDYFVYFSSQTKRTIHEQILDLSHEEKYKIVLLLETCYNTEARYYRYDFLMNNCATKIRDIIADGTEGRIDFAKADFGDKSFRELLKPFVEKDYWLNFGINLAMGRVTDEKAKPEDYMFLPVYIYEFLENSDFVSETHILLDASPQKIQGFNFSYLTPWLIVLIILGLSIWKKSRKLVFYVLMTILGLLGLFILSIGIYSIHPALGHNMNILWTIPAVLVLILRKGKAGEIVKISYAAIIALIFVNWFWFPQEMSPTFIPWMLMILAVLILNSNFKNLKASRSSKS